MKKSTITFFYYISIVLLINTFFYGCSKIDDIIKTEPISLSTEKTEYAPYEIVTISVTEDIFTVKSFTAKINETDVIVGCNDNLASFVLPDLPNGHYNLNFNINNKDYVVPIHVTSLNTILSADEYFNDIQTNLNQIIGELNSQLNQLSQNSTNLNEYENLQNDVVKYTTILNDFSTSYTNLSASDKQEFAKTMAANKAAIDEYNLLTYSLISNTASLKNAQSIQDYESGVEMSKTAYLASIAFTIAHIPAMITTAKLIASPNPWVSAGAVLATGVLFTSYCINLDETITASVTLTSKAIKPFEFIAQTSEIIYDNGVEQLSNIAAKYKSITDSDSNNGNNGSTINTIVEKYNYFKEKYNGFVNEIPAIFRPSYIMTSLKNTYTSTTRSIYNNYITISDISNSNVTLQQINQPDGSINIKASTTATTDQTFSYKVTYTNGNFTNGLSQTVNAKVIAQSCDINEIIGTWNVEMYNTCYPNPDGTPAYYQTGTLVLYPGGQSLFTYSDGSQYPGTYTINSNCGFSYNNLSWCGGATGYPISSPYYGNLDSCGCLSLKHVKQ